MKRFLSVVAVYTVVTYILNRLDDLADVIAFNGYVANENAALVDIKLDYLKEHVDRLEGKTDEPV